MGRLSRLFLCFCFDIKMHFYFPNLFGRSISFVCWNMVELIDSIRNDDICDFVPTSPGKLSDEVRNKVNGLLPTQVSQVLMNILQFGFA
jgi:hypothetical protein